MSKEKLSFLEIKVDSNDYRLELQLRDRILRKPLGLSIEDDDLRGEIHQKHLACFKGQELVGVLLIIKIDSKNAKIRQVTIENNYQGQGIGSKLMTYAENFARELGYKKITLHSRKTAELFYSKCGYKSFGEVFIEVGIEHINMYKNL